MERNLHANQVAGVWGWLQSIDYGYNAQGWLTAINNWNPTATVNTPAQCAPAMPNPASPARTFYNEANDLMYMDIRYDQLLGISGTSGTIQKAGNISQIAWRARGRETQIYSYGYDYLSRLTTSTYYNYSDAAVVSGTNNYNENLSYDLRGNIQTLQRSGFYTNASTCTFGEIDNLTYSYTANTNRLHKVLDATVTAGDAKSRGFNGLLSTVDNSMTYDANGNLIKSLHKNVSSISYNHLNLPTVITFTTGNTIEFLYDAGGSKLRKTVKVGGVVQYVQDYIGGIEYRQTGAGVKRIESIFHAEGRYYNTNVDASNTVAWRKEYNFKDHLGNTRLVFTDRNGNGVVDITGTASTSDVLQENHYYAFGMAFEGAWLQNDPAVRDNKYQYNGKELNDDFGLNWNDYGARWYDASIGRWNGVDAMAEEYFMFSPLSFALNNPIRFFDPNGMEIFTFNGGITFTGEDARIALEFYKKNSNQPKKELRAYIVNRIPELLSDTEAKKAISHAENIFKMNGINIKFSLTTKGETKKQKLSVFEYFLEIQNLEEKKESGGFSERDFDENNNQIAATYYDQQDYSYSYVNWSFLGINVDGIKKPSKIYGLGYLIAHEIFHQILGISASYFGLNDGGKCKNGHFYSMSCPHVHDNSGPNLNADGNIIMNKYGFPRSPKPGGGLNDVEKIIGWRHWYVIKKLLNILK